MRFYWLPLLCVSLCAAENKTHLLERKRQLTIFGWLLPSKDKKKTTTPSPEITMPPAYEDEY